MSDLKWRRGVVLILVLVVITLLSFTVLVFAQLMLAEHQAADLAVRRAQARALADSGIDVTRLFITQDEELLREAGSWFDNPTMFQAHLLVENNDARRRGRFAVVSPREERGQITGIRFGLEDESSRMNLNLLIELSGEVGPFEDPFDEPATGSEMLMNLPGMTRDIADAILDWIDEDNEQREFGAESDYYLSLDTPYSPRNGPLQSIEELLLVRDVTPWLLFGVDANRNGYVDGREPQMQTIGEADNSDYSMNRGWAAFLTLHSRDANLRPDGQPKIDVNQEDMEALQKELNELVDTGEFEESWVTFILAFRQSGAYEGVQPGSSVLNGKLDLSQGGNQLETILDLLVPKVQATLQPAGGGSSYGGTSSGGSSSGGGGRGGSGQSGGGSSSQSVLNSPFGDDPAAMGEFLPALLDNLSVETEPKPKVSVNYASRDVLMIIPTMTVDLADQIVGGRFQDPTEMDDSRRHATWLLVDGLVSLEEMKALMPYVCGSSKTYRGQVIGYFDGGGPATRIEFVLDAASSPAEVISWKDLSHLGRGYPLEFLGTETP